MISSDKAGVQFPDSESSYPFAVGAYAFDLVVGDSRTGIILVRFFLAVRGRPT